MSRGDGKNPKFRILCKRCNSYQHTSAEIVTAGAFVIGFRIACTKCGNTANKFDEEA
jgi:hypothetical protein